MLSVPISLLRSWRNEHGSALPQIQHHHLKYLPYVSFPLQFLLLFWIKTFLFCFLLVLMISTDPLLLNEMELKLAAKHYEKQSTLKQVIQKLNIILGYFKLEVGVSTSLSWLQSPGTGWT